MVSPGIQPSPLMRRPVGFAWNAAASRQSAIWACLTTCFLFVKVTSYSFIRDLTRQCGTPHWSLPPTRSPSSNPPRLLRSLKSGELSHGESALLGLAPARSAEASLYPPRDQHASRASGSPGRATPIQQREPV